MMPAETPSLSLHQLKIKSYALEDAMVVECAGRLTIEYAPLLKSEVKALIAGQKRIILDLAEVAFMDSSGLGTLVSLYISARNSGCKLELCNMSKAVRDLLGMSNLLSVFETCGRYGIRM
jgi:anti-sigma B factor antagonist